MTNEAFPMRWSQFLALALALAVSALLAACDSSPMERVGGHYDAPEIKPVISTESIQTLSAGQYTMNVDRDGWIERGDWIIDPSFPSERVALLHSGGLWVAGEQGGEKRASAKQQRFQDRTNFKGIEIDSVAAGVMYWGSSVNPSTEFATNWLDSLGAPTDMSGIPKKIGSQMAAMVFGSQAENYDVSSSRLALSRPLEGLDVYQEIFAWDIAATDAFFIRFVLTNSSKETMTNVRAAIKTDMDVGLIGIGGGCEGAGIFDNRVGFDSQTGLSYVYSVPWTDNAPPESCFGFVSGYMIVDTPEGLSLGHHRKLDKHGGQGGYGEEEMMTPEELFNTVHGLTIHGDPMVNPVTGESTLFAYDGNPLTGDGWVYPNSRDVRNMLGTEVFELAPGEQKEFVVAWVTVREAGLAAGITSILERADTIRRTPGLWTR